MVKPAKNAYTITDGTLSVSPVAGHEESCACHACMWLLFRTGLKEEFGATEDDIEDYITQENFDAIIGSKEDMGDDWEPMESYKAEWDRLGAINYERAVAQQAIDEKWPLDQLKAQSGKRIKNILFLLTGQPERLGLKNVNPKWGTNNDAIAQSVFKLIHG